MQTNYTSVGTSLKAFLATLSMLHINSDEYPGEKQAMIPSSKFVKY
jgi:hypothetical protein